TEELINALANVDGLRVASRTSAFAFKTRNVGVGQIGQELKVATVVEGSVRREGNNLRIIAQLVDAASGFQLWSKTYERELKNVFALEDELARSIAGTVAPQLVPKAALVRDSTASTAAHDLYFRGRYFWNKRTLEALRRATDLFRQAIDADPGYALAYVGLADTYTVMANWPVPPKELLAKARPAAIKALELDSSLAEAHAAMASVHQYSFEWADAEREYKRAIELKPGYVTAHHWYGNMLVFLGRIGEGRAQLQTALDLDPTSLMVKGSLANSLHMSRDYRGAAAEFAEALEAEPHPILLWRLTLVQASAGSYQDAFAALDRGKQPVARDLALRAYIPALS